MSLKQKLTGIILTAPLIFGVADSAKSGGYTCSQYNSSSTYDLAESLNREANEKIRAGNIYLEEAKIKKEPSAPELRINPLNCEDAIISLTNGAKSLGSIIEYHRDRERLFIQAMNEYTQALDLRAKVIVTMKDARPRGEMNLFIEGYYYGLRDFSSGGLKLTFEKYEAKIGGVSEALKDIRSRVEKKCGQNGTREVASALYQVISDIEKEVGKDIKDKLDDVFNRNESNEDWVGSIEKAAKKLENKKQDKKSP